MNHNTAFETVTARGDHGGITFRKSDGVVVSRDFDSGYENDPNAGYPLILRADPATLLYPDMDILHVGYWYQDSRGQLDYEPAIDMDEDLAPSFDNKEPVTMKPFDLEKAKAGAPVLQRCGRPARIVDFALKNEAYPLAVIYTDDMGMENLTEFSVEGKYYAHPSVDYRDLMMAPVKKECWVNVNKAPDNPFGFGIGGTYATKEDADDMASPNRVACVHIEWEE